MSKVITVDTAKAFRDMIHVLATDAQFKHSLVTNINNCVNIPLCLETHEYQIFAWTFDTVINTLENASDKMYAEAKAAEYEAQQQALKESKKD